MINGMSQWCPGPQGSQPPADRSVSPKTDVAGKTSGVLGPDLPDYLRTDDEPTGRYETGRDYPRESNYETRPAIVEYFAFRGLCLSKCKHMQSLH